VLAAAVTGFALVFAVIGGLELFDRTSFALIALATRTHAGPTWAGGASAFVATTAIAVVAGAALVSVLGPGHLVWLRVGGGAFLIGYALVIFVRSVDLKVEAIEQSRRSAFVAAFLTILLLELGDTTQIFEIVFVADYGWLVVLAAGSAALVLVAGWNVLVGRFLGARISPARLRLITTVVMVVVGAATIAYGLAPAWFGFS